MGILQLPIKWQAAQHFDALSSEFDARNWAAEEESNS